MGQLERYGLYVLCVVIFLILGVALWGGDPLPPPATTPPLEVAQPSPAPRPADDVVERLRREFGSTSTRDPAPVDAGLAFAGVREAATPQEASAPAATPAGPAASAPAAQPLAAREYLVRKDDVLESIAREQLGAGKHWRDILAANPGLVPTKLKPGTKIKLPAIAAAPAQPAAGRGEYVVQKDDVLESIARRELGRSSAWKDIVAANPGLDPRKLQPGMRLVLPRDKAAEQR